MLIKSCYCLLMSESTLKNLLSTTKPRIGVMVLISTALGYYLARGSLTPPSVFWSALLGTFFSCAGAAALNAYFERETDKLMDRTKNRALPQGRIDPAFVLLCGVLSILAGVIILAAFVNLLTAFLALLTAFLYVLVYTPLKRITWLNTTVGAIPGALPIMGGWSAAANSIDSGAWILFAIMFIWQHPHFYAIAWLYKEDYRKAGMQMLPVVDESGRSTLVQILLWSMLLIPVSLLPIVFEMASETYLFGALFGGTLMLYYAISFSMKRNMGTARNLLRATLVYLPLILSLVVIDARFNTGFR